MSDEKSLKARLELAIVALDSAQKYICQYSHSCMRHPEGLLPVSHGPACDVIKEMLKRIRSGDL